ncbi:hypothetical protein DOTSEDRAFT_67824 [Dothistroma septosporum NZE10]|uniref:O-acyltransferase n=1 Tax=Dothistroma septosporum (strain NZE10 / CBS 128990) TaxID=675120 RepID=N1PZM8_DOTSN|nr:hypothetical protein DOTSEDRAFT_67824 [Dothistroma septosporum NZE10]
MSDGSPRTNAASGYGYGFELHHPSPTRARKLNPQIARAFNNELSANAQRAAAASGIISERNTPAPPDDAPPSVKATSAARRANRRATRRRIFPTVDYQERLSYFDPQSSYANFRGFFILFWVGLAIMVITQMLRNVRETGTLLNFRQWPLFTQDLVELGYSDLLMCGSTAVSLPLHLLFVKSKGLLQWKRGGIIIQSLYQAAWLWFWIGWPFLRDWTWTAQVFFTLHTLVLFMKMHSYAFYNGHLSDTLNRLRQLDMPIGPATPLNAAVHYPSASFRLSEVTSAEDDEDKEESALSPVLQLREDLAKEVTSPMGNVTYPQNLTIANFADYLLCPTLCYELEYPRMPKRSYLELFYKTLAVFGCIFLMTVVSEEFIIPILDESRLRLHRSRTGIDGALMFAEAVSRLLFPFMITFLLVFMVIFEYVLGAFAEITQFADRQFYDDWWNSTDWMEFSREWNIPVHHFFRRHVYSASRGIMSKPAATALTFLISALAHELIMGCITRKFRGYGAALMMLQIPIVAIQQLPFIKRRELLNNILFWISMILGLSLLCALYVLL